MADLELQCACGQVQGTLTNANANNGNRVVCCCHSCQTFANHLGKGSEVLDAYGGTDIYQTSQSQVFFQKGQDQLRCLRLTRKGLTRWYTDCCKTPVANTASAGMPFAGLLHSIFKEPDQYEAAFGTVRAHVQLQDAIGDPNYPNGADKYPLGITLRIMRLMLGWKIRGMQTPSVFFGSDGRPVVKPEIINEQTS
ncbi:MAG: hypothetical protein KTR35_21715 [Gammaproteobacteria bacterium]|nr:hypothetical protein [Gammaproteobacteria bacterium]